MTVYILYYCFITVMYWILFNSKCSLVWGTDCNKCMQDKKKIFIIVAGFVWTCIVGLRVPSLGNDINGYYYYYDFCARDSYKTILTTYYMGKYANFEIGYVLLCKTVDVFFHSKQALLFFAALAATVPVQIFLYRYSKNPWLSWVIYLGLPFSGVCYFSGIRQNIALSIVLLATGFAKEKKIIPFSLLILLATTFHKTAPIGFFIYLLMNLRIKKKEAVGLGTLSLIILWIFNKQIFTFIGKFTYRAEIQDTHATRFFILLVGIYYLSRLFFENKEVSGYLNLLWVATAIEAFAGLNYTIGRLGWFFLAPLGELITEITLTENIKEKQIMRYSKYIFAIMFIGLGLYYLRYDSVAQSYPYVFLFDL